MTKQKNTKRALLASVLSMMLCVAMLIGSTFAWFTDSVTSGNNRIVAGNLKIDLVMDKTGDGTYVSIANGEGDIFTEEKIAQNSNATLWEPGKTQIVYLGVQNKGSLALKYNIVLNVVDGGLIGSLEYAILDGKKAADLSGITSWTDLKAMAGAQTGDMVAGSVTAAPNGRLDEIVNGVKDETDYFALAVHMKETADNKYMNKDVTIDVTVVATQADAESDSFGPDYDKDALYPYELAKFSFMSQSEDKAFCPHCYNHPETSHKDHLPTLTIADGVAVAQKEGAWTAYKGLDWSSKKYTIEMDIDVSALESNAYVTFDSGETTAWVDLQLCIQNKDGVYTAYNALKPTSKSLGEIKNKFHVAYNYGVNDGKFCLEMIVSDGTNTYTVNRTSAGLKNPLNTGICWDIYDTDGGSENAVYAKLSNFRVYSAEKFAVPVNSVDELKNVLENAKAGDVVKLTKDLILNESLKCADGVTIDGNGNTITYTNATTVKFEKSSSDRVIVKNANFVKGEKGPWGIVSANTEYHNCTFTGICPYIVPQGDIVIDGCTFDGQTLQIAYNESGTTVDIKKLKTVITNNTFIVANDTWENAHGIILNACKKDNDFWAQLKSYVTMSGNTFKGKKADATYTAYTLKNTGEKLENIDAFMFGDNTFNGSARYTLNSHDLANSDCVKIDIK